MGIYDRDYIRDDAGTGRWSAGGGRARGGRGGVIPPMRVWSVTTWIIVACIAVFLIDAALPMVPVSMGLRFADNVDAASIDESALIRSDMVVTAMMDSAGRHVTRPGGWSWPLEDDPALRAWQPLAGERALFVNVGGSLIRVGVEPISFMRPIESLMHFSTYRGFLQIQFWRLIGFQFLHAHGMFAHLLFNMIGLFFFGPMVEQYLGRKRFLAFYLLCGIFGALMYVLLNITGFAAHAMFGMDRVPGLLFDDPYTPLIGASAGVFGVIMAGAYLNPNAQVLLFFIIPMRLATLAYALVAVAFLTVLFAGENAGGEAGHLGGAVAGFYFIRHAHHLHDFFDILGRVDPTSHHYRGRKSVRPVSARRETGATAEVDRILDKIRVEGLQSLTDREKRVLSEASRDGRT